MNEDTVEGGPSQQEEILQTKAKLDKLLRHIKNVQEACELLGKKLIEKNEINLGIRLIAEGMKHDNSKFFGIEWDYLVDGNWNGESKLAAIHHGRSNTHHPEYWGTIDLMPRIAVAQMCCDWWARSFEFGENVWEYVKKQAMPRYNISPQGKVYKWIKEFFDLMLDKPFTKAPSDENS